MTQPNKPTPAPSLPQAAILGGVLGILATLLLWPLRRPLLKDDALVAERLDLSPWIASPADQGGLADLLARTFTASAWLGPAAVGGLVAIATLLAFRLAVVAGMPLPLRAAAVCGAALAALPGTQALVIVIGGEAHTVGVMAIAAGALAATWREPLARLGGAGLLMLGTYILPGALPLALGGALVPLLTGPGRLRNPAVAVGLLGSLLAARAGAAWPIPVADPLIEADRLGFAFGHALRAPALAVTPGPRAMLATGHEALNGGWSSMHAALGWGIPALLGVLLAGWRAGLAIVLLAGFVAVGAPFLSASWIPGDRATAWLGVLPLLLLPLFLGRRLATSVLWRDGLTGTAIGLILIGFLGTYTGSTQAWLGQRRTALHLDGGQINPGATTTDPDPARIVLVAHDLSQTFPRESQVVSLARTARTMLADPELRAFRADQLQALINEMLQRAGVAGQEERDAAEAAERELLQRLVQAGIETRLTEILVTMADREGIDTWYVPVMAEVRERILFEAMELAFEKKQMRRLEGIAASLYQITSRLAAFATLLGDTHFSIPLRTYAIEYRATYGLQADGERIYLGVDQVDAGMPEEGIATIDAALPGLGRKDVIATVGLFARARARLSLGEASAAMDDLKRAWTLFSRIQRPLHEVVSDTKREHWQIMEGLLLRWEQARTQDPELAPAARRDLDQALSRSGAFGIRRVPQLLIQARVAIADGEADRARKLLEALRDLDPPRLVERGDGPTGRLDDRRWRRLGLETLLGLLGAEEEAVRADVEARIAALIPE